LLSEAILFSKSQTKIILPALADPAAEGDPAYPVLYWMLFIR